jgi:TPR repeat protein
MNNLGLVYKIGAITKQNYIKAMKYFNKAIEASNGNLIIILFRNIWAIF